MFWLTTIKKMNDFYHYNEFFVVMYYLATFAAIKPNNKT